MTENGGKTRGEVLDVVISEIIPSRWQARRVFDTETLRELAMSIRDHGLITPILGFRNDAGAVELIAGERRFRAVLALGLAGAVKGGNLSGAVGVVVEDWQKAAEVLAGHPDKIPTIAAEIRTGDPAQFAELALIDNLQREGITAIEEAEAYNRLMVDRGLTQSALAALIGKSAGYVSQRLALLDLDEPIKAATAAGAISFSAARAISSVPAPAQEAVRTLASAGLDPGDPANARQVAQLAGKVKRFLDPDRWAPADDSKTIPMVRNRYRLLQYHIKYAIQSDPDSIAAAVVDLGTSGAFAMSLLGKTPARIADSDYTTIRVLQAVTRLDGDPYQTLDLWWADLAKLRGDRSCRDCRLCKIALDSDGPAPDWVLCPRWSGAEVGTCPGWLGQSDPVWIKGTWDIRDALAGDLDTLESGAEKQGISIRVEGGHFYFDDLDHYRRAVDLAITARRAKDARAEERARYGWLDPMRAYWQAQAEAGPGSALALTNAEAHGCRHCADFRPDLLDDPIKVPCRYGIEPLIHWYNREHNRAPVFAVLVRSDGIMVPRCERFRAAEVPALDPVRGVRFPEDPDGRREVLGWLAAILAGDRNGRNHEGALVGPLAWLPYDRPVSKSWDSRLAVAWIAEHWRDCGGDRGIARLLSVAAVEVEARQSKAPFELIDPMTGELWTWIAIPWEVWQAGSPLAPGAYGIPAEWDQPWARVQVDPAAVDPAIGPDLSVEVTVDLEAKAARHGKE